MIWTPSTRGGTVGAILDGAKRSNREKESFTKITTIGIDLAKTTLSVHGVDDNGKVVLRKTMSRATLLEFMANREPCLVGMEACGGAHDLARRLIAMGHRARLMAAHFVQPYRKSQKNDGNDAEAICEAVARPNMRPSRPVRFIMPFVAGASADAAARVIAQHLSRTHGAFINALKAVGRRLSIRRGNESSPSCFARNGGERCERI